VQVVGSFEAVRGQAAMERCSSHCVKKTLLDLSLKPPSLAGGAPAAACGARGGQAGGEAIVIPQPGTLLTRRRRTVVRTGGGAMVCKSVQARGSHDAQALLACSGLGGLLWDAACHAGVRHVGG